MSLAVSPLHSNPEWLEVDLQAVRPGKKYPAVLSPHGRNGSALSADPTEVGTNPEGFIRQLTPGKPLVDTFPAIVIAPNGPRVGEPLDIWWQVDALILEPTRRAELAREPTTQGALSTKTDIRIIATQFHQVSEMPASTTQ